MPVQRISEFDTWRPGYAGASVKVYRAGTTTLASIYTDEAMLHAASNPQTLASYADATGVAYGKFSQPLYSSQSYYLDIESADQTGIVRPPITTLVGEDASGSTVVATGGTEVRSVADRFADFIMAADYGDLGGSAATNTATLNAAIGAAAAAGGGRVLLPAGTFAINAITLSTGVVLMGEGRGVTVVQCQVAGTCLTIGGDGAGLERMTFDGVNLVANSVGVFSKAKTPHFADCEIKRFATGLNFKGGKGAIWSELFITNCATGAKLYGDTDPGGGADGGEFRDNSWTGGVVSQCSVIGLEMSYENTFVRHNAFRSVGFKDNTGIATKVNGARFTEFRDCWWEGNTDGILVQDDDDTYKADENTVISLHLDGGSITGGSATFKNTCESVVLERVALENIQITLTLPGNAVLLRDCSEAGDVTISGDGTKLIRWTSISDGASSGLTTDSAATKAWSITLEPGQLVYLEAVVLANRRDGTDLAEYHFSTSAKRPGSTLAYDAQTANFTVGKILTGQTSGATARIIADSDGGATGTLTLRDISKAFIDNEIIKDASTGSATANGVLVVASAALLGSVLDIRAPREDDSSWAATFVANGPEIELQVTGAASKVVEWNCRVTVTTT